MTKMLQSVRQCQVLGGVSLVVAALGCSQSVDSVVQRESTGLPMSSGVAQILHQRMAIQSLSPDRVNQTVHVEGSVLQRAPLLNGELYQLQDNTGTVWVLSARPSPSVDEVVSVVGILRYEPISVDGVDIGEYYLEESSRRAGKGSEPAATDALPEDAENSEAENATPVGESSNP